jgi:inorganic triphosphatase YgiF
MSREIELKFLLPPAALRRAEQLTWLRRLATDSVTRGKIDSTYFDTKRSKLRRHGVTLRIRKGASKRVQTIKGGNGASAAAGRTEQEDEVHSSRPQLDLARGTCLAPLVDKKLDKRLHPVFTSKVRRAVLPVHFRTSDIEVAFDRGKLVAGRRTEPIHELELELAQGCAEDAAELGRRLAKTLPLEFGLLSKAERGYALKAGRRGQSTRASRQLYLDPDQSCGAAFAHIGLSCLRQVAANRNAVLAGDPEGVHQMRVGIRRLRAAMSLFRDIARGRDADEVKRELKWLAGKLGPARDLDVLASEAVGPLRRSNPGKPEIALLERDVKRGRATELHRAGAVVGGARFRKTVLSAALWLLDGDWLRAETGAMAEHRARPIGKTATRILDRRARKIVKKTERLGALDGRRRHKLRIAVKKLRYGCDFFASLYGHHRREEKYRFALKRLQTCLGRLNDMRVHANRARWVANSRRRTRAQPQKAYAMGFLAGCEQADQKRVVTDAVKAGRKLAAVSTFW